MPDVKIATKRSARKVPETFPIPPVIITPPRTAIVIEGSNNSLPAVDLALSNQDAVTIAPTEAIEEEKTNSIIRVNLTLIPANFAASGLEPIE